MKINYNAVKKLGRVTTKTKRILSWTSVPGGGIRLNLPLSALIGPVVFGTGVLLFGSIIRK